jgi:L-ascorbate metabolism protein UlaG (beta-lactamase superfamily)
VTGNSVRITWWGHATTTIDIGGIRILTDPLLSGSLVHLRRIGGPMPTPEAQRADVVVVSHLHGDHLHIPSLRQLPAATTLIAPSGSRALLARPASALADRVHEVNVGDEVACSESVRITAVTAAHDGRRMPGSRHIGPALGFVIESGATRVWFAGDTGLFDDLALIGPVDIAVVPVGGWGPTLGPEHLDPRRATEAVRLVGARVAIPIHYGTFWPVGLRHVHRANFRRLFVDPGARFADEMASACPDVSVHVLASGETVDCDGQL